MSMMSTPRSQLGKFERGRTSVGRKDPDHYKVQALQNNSLRQRSQSMQSLARPSDRSTNPSGQSLLERRDHIYNLQRKRDDPRRKELERIRQRQELTARSEREKHLEEIREEIRMTSDPRTFLRIMKEKIEVLDETLYGKETIQELQNFLRIKSD